MLLLLFRLRAVTKSSSMVTAQSRCVFVGTYSVIYLCNRYNRHINFSQARVYDLLRLHKYVRSWFVDVFGHVPPPGDRLARETKQADLRDS